MTATDAVAALHTALAAFQAEMPTVAKTQTARIPGKNGATGYSYTYADLGDVSAAATPLLTKHGLAFTCLPRVTERGGYELVGVLTHSAGHRLEGALPLFGSKAQELGSAITYSRRYLLGCMTGIITEEDDDGARAHSRGEQTQASPPPYTGPSTDALLTELDEFARDKDLEWGEVVQPYLDRYGITLEQLEREPAERLGMFVAHVKRTTP
jgi:hypothetical protein